MTDKKNYKHEYVMLVDDVELDNFINSRLIKDYGFSEQVYICSGSGSALEFLNNLLLTGEHYSLLAPAIIFVDINMPVSDGLEFIREFGKLPEQQQKDTRLVLLSSSVFEKDRLELFDLPEQVVFMRKPLTREMLDRL